MKTIKIIDLLNKIANGEELPKKITFDKIIWEYNSISYDYISEENGLKLFNELIVFSKGWLKQEVEIIEDEDTIDIQSIEEIETEIQTIMDKEGIRVGTKELSKEELKINELIRAVKQIDRNNKE